MDEGEEWDLISGYLQKAWRTYGLDVSSGNGALALTTHVEG